MRLEFLFLFIALGILFKYISFFSFILFVSLIIFWTFFYKKYVYVIILFLFVLRLFFFNPFYSLEIDSQVRGYVCGFESHFNDFKFVDLCLESGSKINLKIPAFESFSFGSYYELNVLCELIDGEYKNFYLTRNIRFQCLLIDHKELVSTNFVYNLFAKLFTIRKYAENKLFDNMHYPIADLTAGLLFGFRANFDEFFKFNFTTLGLTHLIAISGYNVSLFLLLVDKCFAYINRKKRMYLYPICLIGFIFLTGFQSSVIRACIMAQIQLLALKTKRHYSALDALIVVVFLFLFINPYQVYYDIGLWLSFLSTFAIVILSPFVMNFMSKYIKSDFIAESFTLTLISFFATYLVSDLFFDNANLFSIIPNLLVAPIVSVLMVIVFQFVFLVSGMFEDFYIYLINLLVDIFVLILNFSTFLNYLILEFLY